MRTVALALIAVAGFVLAGCQSSGGACDEYVRALPKDLPANPDPTRRYCKVWVPEKTRQVPRLRMTQAGRMKTEDITVHRTTAREVMVQGPQEHTVDTCNPGCTTTLVQTKPGGWRWECDGDCWQYRYRPPQYKYCEKTVEESGVKFCYTTPPKFETVVETRPVKQCRQTYVPPKYEVVYETEVYEPGRWEWRAAPSCGPSPDNRSFSAPRAVRQAFTGCQKPSPALDCGCPRTN